MSTVSSYWSQISYSDLVLATNNFADKNLLTTDPSSKIYKGKHFDFGRIDNIVARRHPHEQTFYNELNICRFLNHKNIVPIYTSVAHRDARFIITKHEANGSLKKHLNGPNLTWMKRLHICVQIAHALKYLHYDIEDDHYIIHGNISSSKVLLDQNWEPKLHDFRYAVIAKKQIIHQTGKYNGSLHYMDPEYEKTGGLTDKSDVFSFGVVLFEVLFGTEASIQSDDDLYFVRLARSHYEERKLDELIDPDLRKQMNLGSLNIFAETAYYCVKEKRSQRQNMNQVVSKLEEALKLQSKHEDPSAVESALLSYHLKDKSLGHLKFRLRDIELATDNFSESYCIGSGGYGKVYKAQVNIDEISSSEVEEKSEGKRPEKHRTLAIKRIFSRNDEQGKQGFLAEIELLSNVKHPNIVSLQGFCDEGGEMILVYEYVSNGSLADYMEDIGELDLTWAQRLQICIDIAKGLKYLHTSTKDKEVIIHRDIKSANILLDKNWVAKIADFGLSKLHHSNRSTYLTNNIAGTNIYLDPEYLSTGKLKTKSDIYSFGVVLFEIMCGKVAYDNTYGQQGLPTIARECFNEGRLDTLIDPKLKEADDDILLLIGVIDKDSLDTFTKVAYQCLAKTQLERPTMDYVIKELEKALKFQMTNKNNLRISLEAIKSGTQNFSDCNCIGEGRFWKLYKGEVELADGRCTSVLAKRWDTKYNKGNIQFSNELYILSRYKHENIIGLVGYCNEGNEKIIVYKNASNGTLDKHMGDPSLTWTKRLNISIGIAKGLSFLHQGGVDEDNPIKHRDIRCGSILLDGDWNAKICNFEMSSKANINKVTGYLEDVACNPLANIFQESEHVPEKKDRETSSDVYALGLILVDMIFEGIKDQIGEIEATKFDAIAISCLEHCNSIYWLDEAGSVVTRLENLLKFKKLHMSLKTINLATQNFSERNYIGEGRFWKSYEGKVEDAANGCTRVVIAKRWDKMFDEADILFSTELDMLSVYKHRNIIGLVGYCDEDNEKIIIYEHARNGSLDKHLGDPSLTWKKRLNIGIGVAEALSFLDNIDINLGGIRSGSILLDGNWNAKISNIDGYVDPENQNPEDRKLYSLGVILTEMLCGRLAWPTKDQSQSLGYLASSCYSLKGNIDDMIFEGIKEQIDPQSLAMFQATAIKCLDEQDMGDYSTRFYTIASELEMALRSQEDYEALEPKLPINYKTIIPEKFWTDKNKLYKQLFQGILHKDGKVFYSIGINGEGNELISARKFSYKNPSLHKFRSIKGSRFSTVSKMFDSSNLNIHIKIRTNFLCPSANYKVHLIFKFCGSRKSQAKPMYVNLKYKMGNESLCSYFATCREDGWMMVELFRFFCRNGRTVLEVLLESFPRSYCGRHSVYIEGIQFQEIRNVKHEEVDKFKEAQQVIVSDLKTNEIKEDKMLRAREVVHNSLKLAIQSRFEGDIEFLRQQVFHIKCKIKSETLSSNKENACYLVFKLSNKVCGLHGPIVVRDLFHWRNKETRVFYFRPQKLWNLHDNDLVPKKRTDGWMEVIVWKYNSNYKLQDDHLFVNLKLVTYEGTMAGLVVRSIEFR